MNVLLRENQMEEEFDIDDIIVLPKKDAPPQGGGGGGGGQDEDEDDFEPDDAESELDRQAGDDHSGHSEGDDEEGEVNGGEEGEEGEGDDKEPTDANGNPIDADDLEEHSKRVSSKTGKQQDSGGDEHGDQGSAGQKGGRGGRGAGGGSLNPRTVDWKGMRPRYDWKTLLARLVRSSNSTEVTYQKVHRRNITSVHVAADTGAGVVRPGEKEVESNLVKLCIVVDSSGSMHEAIKTVLANVQKLLTENSSAVSKSFAFVEFSSDYHMYLCTINGRGGTAVPIKSVKDIGQKGIGKPESIQSLLSRHQGGATNFTENLAAELSAFAAQKYNILIMSDTDIMGSGNKETFLELYAKHHQQVYLILDSRRSWQAVVQAMKGASANISHM